MSYLVFANYGSATQEELVCESKHIFHAIERAEMHADICYPDETVEVITYDDTGKPIVHHSVQGNYVDTDNKMDFFPDEDWWEFQP